MMSVFVMEKELRLKTGRELGAWRLESRNVVLVSQPKFSHSILQCASKPTSKISLLSLVSDYLLLLSSM